MLGVPKGDGVEECAFGFFLENLRPRLSAVGGAVDAGLAFFCWAGTHEDSGLVVESADAAKIQVFGFWNF